MQDYAKQFEPHKPQQASLGLLGSLVALTILAVIALSVYHRHHHTNHQHQTEKIKKTEKIKVNQPTHDHRQPVKFDFYTLLPTMSTQPDAMLQPTPPHQAQRKPKANAKPRS